MAKNTQNPGSGRSGKPGGAGKQRRFGAKTRPVAKRQPTPPGWKDKQGPPKRTGKATKQATSQRTSTETKQGTKPVRKGDGQPRANRRGGSDPSFHLRHPAQEKPVSPSKAHLQRVSLTGQPLIWGFHPVSEALRAPKRKILRLFSTSAAAERLSAEIAAKKIEPLILEPAELDRLLPKDAVHQGLAAEVVLHEAPALADLPDDGLVLVLDQITDPHNTGAIIRTAAAFSVNAIVMTQRHAPALAGVVAKSASGGLEHVPVITVVNLARALEELGALGYWRIGLDSDGDTAFAATDHRPLALVLGAEGKGLRRLSRENCDVVQRLDMPGAIESLNVSNACAVALALTQSRS